MVVSVGRFARLAPAVTGPEDAPISAIETTPVDYRSPDENPPVATLPHTVVGALKSLAAPESAGKKWTFVLVALAITGLFFVAVMTYWVPVHGGVDQNGYLFGGRQLAQTGTMKFAPADPLTKQFDPHQFVGRMWVGTDYGKPTERFYPKYPIGLPLVYAVMLKLGGPDWGPWLCHLVNPISMSLAVFATFLLIRTYCGSYMAILGQLVFATSPVTMFLAIDPNSHATAVFCVAWGMVGLFAWWKRAHPVVALFAGLLIGYSVTIRYTEATLLLPIVLVVAFRLGLGLKSWRIPVTACKAAVTWILRRKEAAKTHVAVLMALMSPVRDWIGAAMLLLGWTIPVAGLLVYNLIAIGTPTGYDPTNESKPGASFNFDHAFDNWETTLRHLAINGLFFFFPVAVMGMAWMFAWRRKAALVMAAWILPCLLAYTFYYWAPDGQGSQDIRTFGNLGVNIGFLRFYTTILPALACCGVWAMGHLTPLIVKRTHHWTTRIAAYSAVPIMVLLSCAVHLHNNARDMENNQYTRLVMRTNVEQILNAIPEGSAIFYQDHSLFHHLQFARNYLLYDVQTYREQFIRTLTDKLDPDDPQGLDPGRSQSMSDRLKAFTQPQLDEQQRQAANACLETGHRVFVIEAPQTRPLDNRRVPATNRPRPLPDPVRKLTAKPTTEGATQLYADVTARWRRVIVPRAVSEARDEKQNTPRQARQRINAQTYDLPWLVYEITKKPIDPPSPERQAMLDAEAKEAAEKQNLDKIKRDAELAKQEADKKRQEEQKKRQDELRLADQERQKTIKQQEALLKELEGKIAQSKAAAEKATADAAATSQQLTDLKAQHSVANDAVKRAAADRQTIEAAMAQQRQQQGDLQKDLENRVKQQTASQQALADTEKKLAIAKADLEKLTAASAKAAEDLQKTKADTEKLKAEQEKPKQPPPSTAPTTRPQ